MTTLPLRVGGRPVAIAIPDVLPFRLAATGILALAALVRFFNLGAASLWYDEGFSAFVASEPVLELIAHTARDIHPPLYYLLLHGWLHLAGKSDFALAFFSLVFGVLSVALVIALGRRWFGAPAGTLAGLVTALAPFQIWYAQEVRMYTLAAFLGLVLMAAVARGERRDVVIFSFTGAAGLYVLYYTAFLLIAVNLFAIASLVVARRLPGCWTLPRWVGAQALVLLLYLPWLPIAVRQAVAPAVPPWREPTPPASALFESFIAMTAGHVATPSPALLLLTAGLIAIALTTVRHAAVRQTVLLCATSVLGPIFLILAVSAVTPLFHPRYVFPFSLPFNVLIGLGLARLADASRALGVAATAALVIGFAGAVHAYHADDRIAPDDYRAAVAFLAERWRPGDAILVNAGYVYAPFVHYWPGPIGWRGRLTDTAPPNAEPVVYQTGTIDGPPGLGGGDPRADFYPTTWPETEAGLRRIASGHQRLWVLRGYDTVTDPTGLIRRWLVDHGRPFEDVVFRGPSNIRVQGWIVGESQPQSVVATDGPFSVGVTEARGDAPAGGTLPIALAWRPAGPVDRALRAYLALVDREGRIWAQQDEPAVGTAWTPGFWQPGRWVADPRVIRVPVGVPPGEYQVELGAYLAGGQVLEFERPTGRTPRLPIGQITVQRATGLPDPKVSLPVGRELAAGLRLIGVDFAQFEVKEGDTLRPTLVWRATKSAPSAPIMLRLVLADGSVTAATDGAPVGGRYPMREWEAGEVVRDPRELLVAAGASGVGRLEVSAGSGWLGIADVRIESRPRRYDVPALGRPVGARLGETAELVAATLTDGRPARVTLVWRAIGRTETNYTVFVQALDAAGRVVAQRDVPPLAGDALTTSWLPGEVLVDELVLTPRPDTPTGEYRVIAGLYDPRNGVRLRQPDGIDYVVLGVIRFD